MPSRPLLFLLLFLSAVPVSVPAARGQDGGGAPPPPDNRFFPKEMEDALAALEAADPEDAFRDGLAVLARLRFRDGGAEALRKEAFAPILAQALGTRLEFVASFSGEILAGLDAPRLAAEVGAAIDGESDSRRLFNAAVLLEEIPWSRAGEGGPDPVDPLVKLTGKGTDAVRIRACEALGQVASRRREPPDRSRERAVSTLLANYGGAGKNFDLKNVCAVALGKVGDAKAIPSLLSGLGVTDGKHGFFAALALGWMEDPSVFSSLQAMNPPGGGESLEAYAKAFEASARAGNVEALLNTLNNSGKAEMREAAAIALGRIVPSFAPPGGQAAEATGSRGQEWADLRRRVAEALFERMVADRDVYTQWACFHAVSRCGGPWLEAGVMKILQSSNPRTLARAVHLAGDWRIAAAASTLGRAVFSVKDDLMRRRCAVEFWRIGDGAAVAEFTGRLRESRGGVAFARGTDALGSWRTPEGFQLALELLRGTRDRSAEQWAAELCLEKMTGHFFGPYPGVWNKWFEKNPEFFTPRQAGIERAKWREEFDKENRGFRQTRETEKAVQMGLEYLARHQDPDGAWNPQRFRERCDLSPPCSVSTGTRVQEDPVSRASLSVLAFLGAGYSPEAGKFKTAIRRALEYLMARQQAHGDYLTHDLIGGYDRPLCLQAYAEAYALTHDPVYAPFVQKGADFLTQIQNSIGGWRYRVDVETSDSSVAAWMLFAMKAAEKAGAEVRPIVYEGCRMLFERYSQRVPQNGPREDFIDIDPDYGFEVGKDTNYEFRTGYQDQAYAPTHATTALGLMSHILLGFRRSHPFCIGSANHVLARQMPEIPKGGDLDKLNIQQEYPMYFLYYGTLAMHQMGGRYFRVWNERLREILPGTQVREGCARGSWVGKNLDGVFGSMYTTATGVLALETYYRYLPVLQD